MMLCLDGSQDPAEKLVDPLEVDPPVGVATGAASPVEVGMTAEAAIVVDIVMRVD